MPISTTIRLAIAASVVALTAAAPTVFAQSSDNTTRPDGAPTNTAGERQTSPTTKVRHVKHMKHKHHKKMMRHQRTTSPASEPIAAPKY